MIEYNPATFRKRPCPEWEGIKYGYLYNWDALTGGVSEGDIISNTESGSWRVASLDDWDDMIAYVDTNYNVAPNDFGVANHLKSCRQDGTPVGRCCNTTENPRWLAHGTQYGRDTLKFSAVPSGRRETNGVFEQLLVDGGCYTSYRDDAAVNDPVFIKNISYASSSVLNHSAGHISSFSVGRAVRLVRDVLAGEVSLPDGLVDGGSYVGNDGKIYPITKIGSQIWLARNLAETKYRGVVYNLDVPFGWLVPTADEWEAERLSWSSNDRAGAFASPLKLTSAGYRLLSGSLNAVNNNGFYWSSTVDDTNSQTLGFMLNVADMVSTYRAFGKSVRLIKQTGSSLVSGDQTFTYNGASWTYREVESNGRIWMDRNLGASQVATAFDDSLAYGDLFQWGRNIDGHQVRTSGTTVTLSSSDTPGHGDFIVTSVAPNDWRDPQNDDLWQVPEIPNITDQAEWANLYVTQIGARCAYDNDEDNV